MSTSCERYRFGLDNDEGREFAGDERQARDKHILECANCREEMKGVVVQRATIEGVFRSGDAQPALSESLVKSGLSAMVRAAREDRGPRQSTG